MKVPGKEDILPAITFCLCLFNLCRLEQNLESYSFYVSIFGLLAVALYVLRVNNSRFAFYIWAACQLILIRQEIPQGTRGMLLSADILDLSQGFKLALYAPLKITAGHYEIGVNMFALLLLLPYRFFRNTNLKGAELTFFPYQSDNNLGNIFPFKGKVSKSVTLSGQNDWLLVKLNQALKYDAMTVEYVLVKRSDKQELIPGKINQRVYFKPVPDINKLQEGEIDISDFSAEVCVLCR